MKCSRCQSDIPEGKGSCPSCGLEAWQAEKAGKTTSEAVLPVGTVLEGKYRIEEVIAAGAVTRYKATCKGETLLIKEKTLRDSAQATGRAGEAKKSAGGTKRDSQEDTVRLADTPGGSSNLSSQQEDTVRIAGAPGSSSPTLSFKEEFELLNSLDSSGFQKAYDHFSSGGREYVALEYVSGSSLADMAAEGLTDEETAVTYAIQLCQRIEKVHQAGYVHLNVEPYTIFFHDGQIRLFSFERALRQGERREEYLTSDGYSAPELVTDIETAVNHGADVYSIGAILHWMLTRQKVPLTGPSPSEILSLVPSPDLARILLACLATDPELRYKTADQLMERLVAYKREARADLQFDTAMLSDKGMARRNNEDSCLVVEPRQSTDSGRTSYGLYLVADGMGGEQAGEVASARAVERISSVILENLRAPDKKPRSYAELVQDAIGEANREIYNMAGTNPTVSGMGTTVTLGFRVGNEVYVGHVGDSRAYLIREGKIEQLTHDHSVVGGLIKAGMITPEEAKHHPERGKIFRCLGNSPTVFIDTYREIGNEERLILQSGDSLVFCTDGLTNYASDEDILATVEEASDAYHACQRLVWLANQRGGDDNISVIVARAIGIR